MSLMFIINSVKKLVFNQIFPRGKQYVHNLNLQQKFEKHFTDSRKICVWYQEQKVWQNSKGTVILAHPYLKEAKLFFANQSHKDIYLQNGFNVVIFDFNGFGESKFNDFHFDKDIDEVVSWIKMYHHTSIIIGHGISFGASQLIVQCSKNTGQFSGLVIENCIDKSLHYFKRRNLKVYYFLKFIQVINPSYKSNSDFVSLMKNIHHLKSVAFIYGEEDTVTTPEMGNKLMAKCKVPYQSFTGKKSHLKAIEEKNVYGPFLEKFLRPLTL
ncbi:MAG: hypothetical protein WAT79_10930 [Saprospiraceae bacterium]